MCSVALCARMNIRDVLCRQMVSLCLTSHREKHMKTRAIIGKVKPVRVVGKSSRPRLDDREQFKDPDYDESFIEDDLHNPLLDVGTLGDVRDYLREVRSEFNDKARRVKRILESKELNPEPIESNLLHWAARQQIRYLHKQDPLEWTPEKIADEFPISVLGAKRLLGNKRRLYEHQIEKFNEEVDARWKLLRKIRYTGKIPEKGPVSLHQKTIELFLDNKLQSEALKAGNPEFPQAPPLYGIRVPYPIGKEGKNFAILQEYTNLLEDESPKTRDDVAVKVRNDPEKLPRFGIEQEIGDDPEAASHLDLPPNVRRKLDMKHYAETMTARDFKARAGIEDQVRLDGKEEPKKVVRKKKLNNSGKSFSKPEKFRDAPRSARGHEESDGTYSVGRNVFAPDGELLYRKSNY